MKKWWILVLVLAVACGGVALVTGEKAPQTVSVDTVTLQPRLVEQTVTCSGVVESRESVSVTPATPCVLAEIMVKEGQAVEVGDVLARVDKTASRAAIQDANGALSLAAMEDTIVATRAGVVVGVATAGVPLEKDAPCVVLAPRSSLQVRLAIRQRDLPRLKVGQLVHITGEGFDKGSYVGELSEISSAAATNPAGETVVEGVVSLASGQADASLRLGLTAKAKIVVESRAGALLLPYEALSTDEQGQSYVYVLEEGYARRRAVAIQQELADGALLADTALTGKTVILQPERVADGTAVAEVAL